MALENVLRERCFRTSGCYILCTSLFTSYTSPLNFLTFRSFSCAPLCLVLLPLSPTDLDVIIHLGQIHVHELCEGFSVTTDVRGFDVGCWHG